mmetsp:Transcript_2324/g.5372  ORF Transcript_2324/g.5372 Transcript_2324/m.5372 type:complete len:422 (-) Transcript_2324:282-1547(-)
MIANIALPRFFRSCGISRGMSGRSWRLFSNDHENRSDHRPRFFVVVAVASYTVSISVSVSISTTVNFAILIIAHLVRRHDHGPKLLVPRSLRPPRLPRRNAIQPQHRRLHQSVKQRHAQGLSPLHGIAKYGNDRRGAYPHVLITALHSHGDHLRFLQSRRDGQSGGDDEADQTGEGDPQVEGPGLGPELGVPLSREGGEQRREEDEEDSREGSHAVGESIEAMTGYFEGGAETQSDGDDDDGEADEEGSPVDVFQNASLAVVVRFSFFFFSFSSRRGAAKAKGGVDVQEQVGRQHDGTDQGRNGRHGDAQGQVGIEHAAPPVGVTPAGTGRDDEEAESHGLREAAVFQEQDGEVAQQGHDDELGGDSGEDGEFVVHLFAEVGHFDGGGHAEDEEEEEGGGQDLGQHVEPRRGGGRGGEVAG